MKRRVLTLLVVLWLPLLGAGGACGSDKGALRLKGQSHITCTGAVRSVTLEGGGKVLRVTIEIDPGAPKGTMFLKVGDKAIVPIPSPPRTTAAIKDGNNTAVVLDTLRWKGNVASLAIPTADLGRLSVPFTYKVAYADALVTGRFPSA